jgi:diaminopimelate epimerase
MTTSRANPRLAFTKMQGVGNDFVVIDGRERRDLDWSALAIELCDRKFGIGADGLLVLDETRLADVMMRMYNPDGTPDVCGNGLRCVARYAVERGIVAGGGDSLRIATLAGVRAARMHRDADGEIAAVTVSMGLPRFDPQSIPMRVAQERVIDYPLEIDQDGVLSVTALSTGSTHAVTFVAALPDDITFFTLSPQVEHHPLFPDRTSLMWCRVEGPGRLRLRIWERGAGETWGCGTGACAAAVAAILHGYAAEGEPVTVASRGGELVVRWREGETMEMTGPAVFVFEGIYRLDPTHPVSAAPV